MTCWAEKNLIYITTITVTVLSQGLVTMNIQGQK